MSRTSILRLIFTLCLIGCVAIPFYLFGAEIKTQDVVIQTIYGNPNFWTARQKQEIHRMRITLDKLDALDLTTEAADPFPIATSADRIAVARNVLFTSSVCNTVDLETALWGQGAIATLVNAYVGASMESQIRFGLNADHSTKITQEMVYGFAAVKMWLRCPVQPE